ncbi:BRO family protein [Pseudomonas sp.]|uniref:BRO-N domain-containing protein n=1 Tax=Pseudomonas sp. TaxID=306 RepID=UPI002582A9DC|nr:BRO family protein [Pseudomonas sp.]
MLASSLFKNEEAPALRARASGNEINFEEEIVMSKNTTAVSNVIPFAFEAKSVRVQEIGGSPWFCLTDVCSILGYSNSRDAMAKHCREAGVAKRDISSAGQKRSLTFISEGNLYRLIIKSRKEEAQRFESWVCDEVLPAIRKHGRYEDEQGKMQPMVDALLGKPGAQRLSNVMRCRVAKMGAEHQRSATAKLASAVHACFGVPRLELIPAVQFDAAANFIASYAIEGEYIPRASSSIPEKLRPDERYLVSADPKGVTQALPVSVDAYVLTRQEFVRALLVDCDMMVSTEEMFEVVRLATENLRRRSLSLAAQRAAA